MTLSDDIHQGDRRWHDSIRACADLLATQVRQGVLKRQQAEHNALHMGVSLDVLHRAMGETEAAQ